jgi:tRNA modification GTPase
MFSSDDTIVAIATPLGRGGLGVVRISGPAATPIAAAVIGRAQPLQPRYATFVRIPGIDQGLATYFAGPHSYTGEDTVEISVHGSPVVLRAIVQSSIDAGARLAAPGEFTLRAFLHGRLDLIQAEAVADLIDAATPLQARAAFDQLEGTLTQRIVELDAELFDVIVRLEASLDFPDEGYHFIAPGEVSTSIGAVRTHVDALLRDAAQGRLLREGAQVVIVGKTNAGKSSVFNQLAGHARAIVADLPGTTRDLVTERVDMAGVPITLVDTAGLRPSEDAVEREGVERARKAIEVADVLLVVLDGSAPIDTHDDAVLGATAGRSRLVLANKRDKASAWSTDSRFAPGELVEISARTGDGLDVLRSRVIAALGEGEWRREAPAVSNMRHIRLLRTAGESLRRAEVAAGAGGAPEEFVLVDLQHARHAFEEVTGARTPADVVHQIFERFCIGK